jgi:hypothetical protein
MQRTRRAGHKPSPYRRGKYHTTLRRRERGAGLAASIPAPSRASGPTMFARIGVMRALNRHVERVFNSNRKDTHWGKRKVKG